MPQSVKKAKVRIKNLGPTAGKEISAADAKSIRGGDFSCPSRECDVLKTKIIVAAKKDPKVHKVVIISTGS